MISLLISFAVLILGYFVYGRVTEKIFAPDNRPPPAIAVNDGVDCIPMKTWKAFLVQLLNIAGTGPIFGALMGAVFGPVVFLWIVFGAILGGALTWFAVVNDHGFQTIWRYFSFSNQTLAMIALWVASAYLRKEGKYRLGSLLTALPAAFMSAVCMTYILTADEGFRLRTEIAYPAGIAFAAAAFFVYLLFLL